MTDLDKLRALAEAATPGPWHWSGDVDTHTLRLSTWPPGSGRCTVMDFTRWGMQSARPRFSVDGRMVGGDDLATYEVGKRGLTGRAGRKHPSVYRGDVDGINHPDAEFIAAANPAAVLDLLDAAEALERVKVLHTPTSAPTSQHYYCEPDECDQAGDGDLRDECDNCREWYPCSTVRALRGGS